MTVDIAKEDLIISEFLRSIGPWRKHIVIGGGYALIIYKFYLSNLKEGNPPIGTRDLDSLIPRKISEVLNKDLSKHLIEAGFIHFPKDFNDPATEAYTKEIGGSEVEIEFLTDDSSRHNKDKNVPVAGVVAQPLPYIKQSLAHTIEFKTSTGLVGRVVSPQAWIFHKGLTFPLRQDKGKTYKDLYGIWYTASQLESFSDAAIIQLKLMAIDSPQWFKTFRKNLQEWVQNASPIDWKKLEAQDPFGGLNKQGFIRLMNLLTNDVNML